MHTMLKKYNINLQVHYIPVHTQPFMRKYGFKFGKYPVAEKFFEMEVLMLIFPAIDIKDGKCVRLIKGDFNQMTSYDNSPLDQAKIFFQNRFTNIHIV